MPIGSIRPVIVIFTVLLILYISALVLGWFDSFPSFDIIMHFLGGVWAAALFLFLSRGFLQYDQYVHNAERIKAISLVVAYAAFVGVLWEFLEFLLGPYFEGFRQGSVRDTLGDLCMDMVGALVYASALFYVLRPKLTTWKNRITQ